MAWNQSQFDRLLEEKYKQKGQVADAESAAKLAMIPMYNAQAQYYADRNATEEGINRNNNNALAGVRDATIRQTDASARQLNTLADEGQFKMGVAQETRPALIADINATRNLNATVNQGTAEEAGWNNYDKFKARVAKMPQYDEPYNKTTVPESRGFLPTLWDGDLYNPLEELSAARTKKMNEEYYKQNPLARPR